MLEEEARIMPLFSHPNVVRTVEVGEQEGQAYLAMEFLDGLPLDQCAEAIAPLGVEAALHVVCELLDGLHYVHELRNADGEPLDIVHRDVSPHNVFVTYEGRVTLVDFGIAKSKGRGKHTSTGVVRGKLAYMAPEQALCDEVDRRTDVFAAAVILWELLHTSIAFEAAGADAAAAESLRMSRYWEGLGDVQVLKRMTFGDLPGIDPAIPSPLRDVLAKALAIKPEERYATAREMRAALVKLKPGNLSRRVLGGAVADAAAGYRDALKAVVDAHLMSARGTEGLVGVDPTMAKDTVPSGRGEDQPASISDPMPASVPGSAPVMADAAAPPSGPVSERVERTLTETGGASSVDLLPRAARPAGRARSWAVLGALAVTAAGLGVYLLLSRTTTPAQQPVEAPAAAPPAKSADAALVTFDLEVTTPGARAFLDDMAITQLPFSAKLERGGKAHALRVEAPGYVPQSRIVVPDRDVAIKIELEKEPEELQRPTDPAVPAGRPIRPPSSPGTSAPPPPSKPTSTSVADPSPPWGKKKTP
jgi:serine/threonine-protein kinase